MAIQEKTNYPEGKECVAGTLIARKFPKNILHKGEEIGIKPFVYLFKDVDRNDIYLFDDLIKRFQLESINQR